MRVDYSQGRPIEADHGRDQQVTQYNPEEPRNYQNSVPQGDSDPNATTSDAAAEPQHNLEYGGEEEYRGGDEHQAEGEYQAEDEYQEGYHDQTQEEGEYQAEGEYHGGGEYRAEGEHQAEGEYQEEYGEQHQGEGEYEAEYTDTKYDAENAPEQGYEAASDGSEATNQVAVVPQNDETQEPGGFTTQYDPNNFTETQETHFEPEAFGEHPTESADAETGQVPSFDGTA